MSKLTVGRYYDENGKPIPVLASDVVDAATKQRLDAFIAKMEKLKALVEEFLNGEPDENGKIDKLSELLVELNKGSGGIAEILKKKVAISDIVNDLTSGGADKPLSAEQGKVLKGLIDELHSFENEAILDGIGKSESGDLTFNGKTLNGETGIAIGSTLETATNFTGKIRIVLEEIDMGGDPDANTGEPDA